MSLDAVFMSQMSMGSGCLKDKERLETWREVVAVALERATWKVADLGSLCGSPVEEMFLAALIRIAPSVSILNVQEGYERQITHDEEWPERLVVAPQFRVGKFSVDFLVTNKRARESLGYCVVEIDGHAFHEKTRQQVAKDKARERVIVTAGYPVLRFSGSEVVQDAARCANELHSVFYPSPKRATK